MRLTRLFYNGNPKLMNGMVKVTVLTGDEPLTQGSWYLGLHWDPPKLYDIPLV